MDDCTKNAASSESLRCSRMQPKWAKTMRWWLTIKRVQDKQQAWKLKHTKQEGVGKLSEKLVCEKSQYLPSYRHSSFAQPPIISTRLGEALESRGDLLNTPEWAYCGFSQV